MSNPQLETVELAGASSGRLVDALDIAIAGNRALGRVSVDIDHIRRLSVDSNSSLTELAVTAFGVAGDVLVRGNGPVRPTFTARSQVDFRIGGSLTLLGPTDALVSPFPLVVDRHCTIAMTHLTSFGTEQVARIGGTLRLLDNPRLAAITSIAHSNGFEIRGNHALASLAFAAPEEIDGEVTIENNAILEAAELDGLKRVIGEVKVWSNPSLKSVFSTLEVVTAQLNFHNNGYEVLRLPNLRESGSLAVSSHASLTEIDAPALSDTSLFGVVILRNPELAHMRLPVLRTAGVFWVFTNPRLPACEVEEYFAVVSSSDKRQIGNDDTAVCGP